MRRSAIMLAGLLLAICARAGAAESFRSQLEKGNDQLRQGNATGALDQYRELLTEDPESPLIHYNMGLAHFGEAAQFVEVGSTEDAVAALDKAKEELDAAQKKSRDPKLNIAAAYNHANATAQQGKYFAEAGKGQKGVVHDGKIKAGQELYGLAVSSFEGAVKEYEELLKREPDHAGARQNLNHVRYLLKSMLQDPPPPEEQQQQQQGGNTEQDQAQQKEGEGQEQPQCEQPKPGDDQQQQLKDGAGQQQAAEAQQGEQKDQQDQQTQAESSDSLPEGNTEALLQSLEETDERERKEVRDQQPRGNPSQGNWW